MGDQSCSSFSSEQQTLKQQKVICSKKMVEKTPISKIVQQQLKKCSQMKHAMRSKLADFAFPRSQLLSVEVDVLPSLLSERAFPLTERELSNCMKRRLCVVKSSLS